ncbi:MAG TPA: pyridoxamine 5'-phosphate oxidase family protein [Steroidobacteraceae bacterium]|nr:pyridoxamine 5'-phosphate oxidase family protein [Steroidobacteraceae bacterium]
MTNEAQLSEKLWKALKSDMTVMLGLAGVDEGHSQPMTAQLDDDAAAAGGPIWFFTSTQTDLVKAMGGQSRRALAHFASKGHDLFATLHGELMLDDDRARIDRLWNRFVAAWFEGGKDDPQLQLLRFEPEDAQVWLNEHSLLAGVKLLMGRDPKAEYRDKVGHVDLEGGHDVSRRPHGRAP